MAMFPKFKESAPKQSHHNRSHYVRTSMGVGPLTPIYTRRCLPGDIVDLDISSLVNTQALLTPLYGSYRLNIDCFFSGDSLYMPKLWRNADIRTASGDMDADFPYFNLPTVGNLGQVDPSSLLSHLGLPAYYYNGGTGPQRFNAIPLLMYWHIFQQYYANQQETKFPLLRTFFDGDNEIVYYNLSVFDTILESVKEGLDIEKISGIGNFVTDSIIGATAPLGGMLLHCHRPDRMNVILNNSFLEANNVSTSIKPSSDGSIQVDQIVMAKKMWSIGRKNALAGPRFVDWVRSQFGVTPRVMDDRPTFCGSWSTDIFFEDIRATATTETSKGTQYLGDKGSSGKGYMDGSTRRITCDRPGYIMVIASIVPNVDYDTFMPRYLTELQLSDLFKTELNGVGFEDVLVSDLSATFVDSQGVTNLPIWDQSDNPFETSVGKRPAWIDYMTDVNRVRGLFCNELDSWVLKRKMYKSAKFTDSVVFPSSQVLSSAYVDPVEFNQPFAVQDLTAQNFLAQFYVSDVVRSNVSKRVMPHLGF